MEGTNKPRDSSLDMAIRLLKAVGDDKGQYETLMGYIDGLKAGIRIGNASNDEEGQGKAAD